MTALNQTLESGPIVTSPTIRAPAAMKMSAATCSERNVVRSVIDSIRQERPTFNAPIGHDPIIHASMLLGKVIPIDE
jgi:hypothetical protein